MKDGLITCLALVGLFAHTAGAGDTARVFQAPLTQKKSGYFVKVLLNNTVNAEFVVDTGSGYTIISEKLLRENGSVNLSSAPRYPVVTALGREWMRLVVVDKLSVGGAVVEPLVALVSSNISEGVDGLLGMDFLDRFISRIDAPGEQLRLTQRHETGVTYGGKDKEWWRGEYRRYALAIKKYSALKNSVSNEAPAIAQKPDPRSFTAQDIDGIIRVYKRALGALDRRAVRLGVPEPWRSVRRAPSH